MQQDEDLRIACIDACTSRVGELPFCFFHGTEKFQRHGDYCEITKPSQLVRYWCNVTSAGFPVCPANHDRYPSQFIAQLGRRRRALKKKTTSTTGQAGTGQARKATRIREDTTVHLVLYNGMGSIPMYAHNWLWTGTTGTTGQPALHRSIQTRLTAGPPWTIPPNRLRHHITTPAMEPFPCRRSTAVDRQLLRFTTLPMYCVCRAHAPVDLPQRWALHRRHPSIHPWMTGQMDSKGTRSRLPVQQPCSH